MPPPTPRAAPPARPRLTFPQRLRRAAALAAVLVFGSLSVGVLGYRHFAGMSWVDALLNASMILAGMGPVEPLHCDGAKVFASGYALYSGLVLLATMSILVGPFFHRALQRLEVEPGGSRRAPEAPAPGDSPRGDLP